MALFHIIALDKPDSIDLRMATRPAHLDWIKDSGPIVRMAGPFLGDDGETPQGSCFIIEADTKDAAIAWQASDPYALAGLFETVSVRHFKIVVGD